VCKHWQEIAVFVNAPETDLKKRVDFREILYDIFPFMATPTSQV
jgi:hypothetical protein